MTNNEPMQLPDVESLRCFLAAAELPTFRAAARQVALSPAAFSERIRRLEEELGEPLFSRTTRRVELTEAGQRLIPAARTALDALSACVAAVDPEASVLPWSLTLGTRYELGLSWLVPALPVLEQAHPERTVHLFFGDSPALLHALKVGDVDAAVTSVRLTQGGLDYVPVHEERYRLVSSPGLQVRGPEDAEGVELIDAAPDLPLFRYFLDAQPEPTAWRFANTRILGTIGAVRAHLLRRPGLAVLPAYFIPEALAGGALVAPLPDAPLNTDHFRLVWRRGHTRAAQLRTLAAELAALPLA